MTKHEAAASVTGHSESAPASPSRFFAIGFDEAGGDRVLARIMTSGAYMCDRWFVTGASLPPSPPLGARESLRPLLNGTWPEHIKRPDPVRVGAIIAAPDDRLIVAMMMLERARYLPELLDTASSVTSGITLTARVLVFWETVLSDHAPDCVIFSRIPHDFTDYLAYVACKRLGTPTMIGQHLQVNKSFAIIRNLEIGVSASRELTKVTREIELSARLQSEYDSRITKQTPSYMYVVARRPSLINSMRSGSTRLTTAAHHSRSVLPTAKKADIRDFIEQRASNLILDMSQLLARQIRNRNAAKSLGRSIQRNAQSFAIALDEGGFIYAPLHLQPEATTSPMAGHLLDQRLLIETVCQYAVASGRKVIVKENPKQIQHFRGRDYWSDLSGIEGLVVAPLDADTHALIERSDAVVTLTGTAGWEAQFLGRGAVAYQSAFYSGAPGVFAFNTLDEVKRCLQQAIEYTRTGSLEKDAHIRQFLASMDEYVYPIEGLNTRSSSAPALVRTTKEINAIADAFLCEISKI